MINEALRLVRVFHNVKQRDLADALGMAQSYLSEIESGKRPATLELLEKYSKHFRLPQSSLLYFAEAKDGLIDRESENPIAPKAVQMLKWLDMLTAQKTEMHEEETPA